MTEEQEFVVRIPPRNSRKTHHVMKFNKSLKIDFTKWTQGSVRMVRENNQKMKHIAEEEQPKFGAGSEFGREQKEEARRKKFGIIAKKYDPANQPWLIRVGDKRSGKRYRGIREGGVAENTTYYVFTHAADGSFEAHPIKEWYNFTPIQTYKTLNAEEAEEKFAERGKILNHWALMVNKKLKPEKDNLEDIDNDGPKSKKNSKKDSSFKISDMDDWVESGDELDTDESDGEKKKDEDNDGKKKSKDSKIKKKKSKEDVDNEAFEDSDDGDDECREVDYMSDESSESENEALEKIGTKGVDQDAGLSKMLDSESSSEDEENKKSKTKSDEEDPNDSDDNKKKQKKKDKKKSGKRSESNSRGESPELDNKSEKRKIIDNIMDPNTEPPSKKSRLEQFASSSGSNLSPLSSNEAALEDDVRRYLVRKPMTTTELVKKINSKKQDLTREELMPLLVNILKKVNPHKSKTKGIMYLSLKPDG